MNISGIACAFPERRVSNQDIVDMVREGSADCFEGDLERALQTVSLYLRHIGAGERRWLGERDNAFDNTERAVQQALAQAGLERSDIDLLIYASIDRRVLEPAMAFFVAKALGLRNAQCFDVTEACSSWTRATQIAQAFLDAGMYQRILIVTSEYVHHGVDNNIENFRLKNLDELEWTFSSYTIGEGSTATVLMKDDDKASPWVYQNRTMADMADMCMVSLFDEHPQTMQMNDVSLAGRGPHRFVSHGREIQARCLSQIAELMRESPVAADEVKLFIPHTQNMSWWRVIEKKLALGKPIPFFFLMPEYGNLINNSFPAAIAMAIEQGKLHRGDTVSALMTAAGMSFTLINFTY